MSEYLTRAFQMDDWEAVADLFQAPNCQHGTLQLPFQSRDDIRKKLENPPAGMHRIVVVDTELDRVLGLIAIKTNAGRRAHACDLGMFVHDDHQGLGLGSLLMQAAIELAERWLQLTRIELTVFADNERAIRLYKKFGFEVEGTHRNFAFRDGEYVDTFAMARLTR